MTTAPPLVPPEALATWLRTVRELADDLDLGRVDSRSAVVCLRVLLDQMRHAAYQRS